MDVTAFLQQDLIFCFTYSDRQPNHLAKCFVLNSNPNNYGIAAIGFISVSYLADRSVSGCD